MDELEFHNMYMNVIADTVDSRLAQLLKKRSNDLEITDFETATLLRYAAGSIDVRQGAIQYLRDYIKKNLTKEENMLFGSAIEYLKEGKKVRRKGWNNTEAFLQLQVPDENSKMTLPYIYIEYPEGSKAYPNGSRVPWLASQTDMLTNDWELV